MTVPEFSLLQVVQHFGDSVPIGAVIGCDVLAERVLQLQTQQIQQRLSFLDRLYGGVCWIRKREKSEGGGICYEACSRGRPSPDSDSNSESNAQMT